MTTISAEVILDSVNLQGHRLLCILMEYPRIIHAELMTHRAFSRNAASSRAIPVDKLIAYAIDNPALPLYWSANQKGMQASNLDHKEKVGVQWSGGVSWLSREGAWYHARNQAVKVAKAFADAGYHKQLCNRLLEPYTHIKVVVSTTNIAHFLALRDHPAAEPHIAHLAREVKKAVDQSTPELLMPGQWHLPFVRGDDYRMIEKAVAEGYRGSLRSVRALPNGADVKEYLARYLSVARCASTSYKTVDGFDMTLERACEIHESLATSDPPHSSPFEHQATPDEFSELMGLNSDGEFVREGWIADHPKLHGNFDGWVQLRKFLPNEFTSEKAYQIG